MSQSTMTLLPLRLRPIYKILRPLMTLVLAVYCVFLCCSHYFECKHLGLFSQYDNDADEDELSNITDCAEVALLDFEISQLEEERFILGLHYRPSKVIEDEIESTENEQVKKKEEVE